MIMKECDINKIHISSNLINGMFTKHSTSLQLRSTHQHDQSSRIHGKAKLQSL